jgi:hypothetical protein
VWPFFHQNRGADEHTNQQQWRNNNEKLMLEKRILRRSCFLADLRQHFAHKGLTKRQTTPIFAAVFPQACFIWKKKSFSYLSCFVVVESCVYVWCLPQ